MKIILRHISLVDLSAYKYWKLPIHAYHELNGPYFKKSTQQEVEAEISRIAAALKAGDKHPVPGKKVISNEAHEILGEVNWYWKSIETNWLEVGIVIFDEQNWGKGIGKQALSMWISEIFESRKEIVRIGITTWSGNKGMIQLARKLGMKQEAVYRMARIVKGAYYDSISYGTLRTEWEEGTHENV